MHAHDLSPTTLLLLGAAHGINPAMGWLFAVSLGLQERQRGAVWGALGPLALGHALAVAAAVVAAAGLGLVLPLGALRWVTAAALLGFGISHLARHRHPRWGGMRVGARDLTIWSFLTASAHGAGLMVVPFLLGPSGPEGRGSHAHGAAATAVGHTGHVATPGVSGLDAPGVLATLTHTAGYLLVAGVIAILVYEKLGLRLLRSAWINLNAIWAAALVVTAGVTLLT
jgi:hypothetical protein